MENLNRFIKAFVVFVVVLFASLKVSSQTSNLKDYCIAGYYASSATSNFKTPFIVDFGENNAFRMLDVSGKIREGRYALVNGTLKLEYVGGEEIYQLNGETVSGHRTFAKLQKKTFDNQLKSNRYTGILYKQNSNVVERVSYQFIGNKFSITGEKGPITSFSEYTLVGNMAGYKWNGPGGVKSLVSHRVFVQYGNQLVVINVYKSPSDGATYGILDQVN